MRIGERLRCPGYAVVAIETTGLSPHRHRIVELAVATCDLDGTLTGVFATLLDPEGPVGDFQAHGLFDDDVAGAPTFAEIAPHVVELLRERVVVAHNARFDIAFLEREFARRGRPAVPPLTAVCTMREAAAFIPEAPRFTLSACCDVVGIPLGDGHGAEPRARATAALLAHYLGRGAGDVRHWEQARTVAASLNWPRRRAEGAPRAHTRQDAHAARRAREEAERARRRHAVAYLEKSRAGGPPTGVGEDADSYLAVLDAALEDRVITAGEAVDLAELAVSLGITEERRKDLDRLYVTALAASMVAAGPAIDREERADLVRVAALLGIPRTAVDDIIAMARDLDDHGGTRLLARGRPLRSGQHVLLHGFLAVGRDELERRLARARLRISAGIHDRVDVLVVADPDESADRTYWARERGIRVLIEPVFLALLADLERATSTAADAVSHSAAVRTAGRGVGAPAASGTRPGTAREAVGAAPGTDASALRAPAAAQRPPEGVPVAFPGAGYAIGPGAAPPPPRRAAAPSGAAVTVPPAPAMPPPPVTTPGVAPAGTAEAEVPRIPPPPTTFGPGAGAKTPGPPSARTVASDAVPVADKPAARAEAALTAAGAEPVTRPASVADVSSVPRAPGIAEQGATGQGATGPGPLPETGAAPARRGDGPEGADAAPGERPADAEAAGEPEGAEAAGDPGGAAVRGADAPGDGRLGGPGLPETGAEHTVPAAGESAPEGQAGTEPGTAPDPGRGVLGNSGGGAPGSPGEDTPETADDAAGDTRATGPASREAPGDALGDAPGGRRPGGAPAGPSSGSHGHDRSVAGELPGGAGPLPVGPSAGDAPGGPPTGGPASEGPPTAGPGSAAPGRADPETGDPGSAAPDGADPRSGDPESANAEITGAVVDLAAPPGAGPGGVREHGGSEPDRSAPDGVPAAPAAGSPAAGGDDASDPAAGVEVSGSAEASRGAAGPAPDAGAATGAPEKGPEAPAEAPPRLIRGQAVAIAALAPHTDALRVEASWAGPDGADADVIVLVLGPDRRVASDDDLVFYNQPVHPSGAVRLAGKVRNGHPGADAADLDLGALDGRRVLVALALDAPSGTTFAHVPVTVGFVDPVTCRRLAEFRIDGGPETVMILSEVYRRGDEWRLRAVGQGYADGLAALATEHGVTVDD